MIGREMFSASDIEDMAAAICLSLAGPARIAASILNVTVWHYARMIVGATSARTKEVLRRDKEKAERVAAELRRLLHALPEKGDGFAGIGQHSDEPPIQDALGRLKVPSSACAPRCGRSSAR